MSVKIELSHEGAQALRDLSSKLPMAMNTIGEETTSLQQVQQNLADTLGEHSEAFGELILAIKNAQSIAEDALNELPPKMRTTADAIDAYVNSQVSIN